MTIIQAYKNKISLSEIRSAVQTNLIGWVNANQSVFEAMARQGQHYGGNIFPTRGVPGSGRLLSRQVRREQATVDSTENPSADRAPNRYSVVYLLNDQHQHVGLSSYEDARTLLDKLQDDPNREPIGIYDDKTELFEWEPMLKEIYDQSSIKEQGVHGEEIITITQALRRRDSHWHQDGFQRPSFFS